MNKHSLLPIGNKKNIFLFFAILFSISIFSQTDTLHLYYSGLNSKLEDSTEKKIGEWVKKLNGKPVDIDVVAYYSQSDFKKYSAARLEDISLVITRKARDFTTIKTSEARKGQKSQRSTVDVIYRPAGTPPVVKEKPVKEKKEEVAVDKKETDKTTVSTEKKETKKEDTKVKKEEKTNAKNNGTGEPVLSAKEKKELKTKQEQEEKEKVAAEKARKAEFDKKYGVPDRRQAGEGQWVKRSEVQEIKAAKLVVAEIGNKPIDDQLFNAVKSYWNFTSDITSMPYNEAKALAKTDEKVVIIFITRVISKSLPHSSPGLGNFGVLSIGNIATEYVNISAGNALMIENGKGKILAASYLAALGADGRITPEIVGYGVTEINYLLKIMDENDLASNLKTEAPYKEKALDQLKQKTLYIPQMWLDKDVDVAEVSNIYKAKNEIVSYGTWKDAILSKKEGVVYVMISPRPVGGEFVYYHCLIDAQTGATYAVCTKGGFINSKSNTATITKSLLEKYNNAVSGEW